MSRIDALIDELCPDGVEYRALADVASSQRGTAITRKEASEGYVPVIAGGRAIAYMHSESNREGETIVVAGSGANAGHVSWWEIPIFVSDAFSIAPQPDLLIAKFCFYWLKKKQDQLHKLKSGGGVPHVYWRDVGKLRIPIPPNSVQRAIVDVLDTFTEMEAELEAELEARKQQYVHFRAEVFRLLGADAQVRTLDQVCESITAGGDLPRTLAKGQSQPSREFPFPIFSNGTGELALYGYTNSYRVSKPAVTISARGTIGAHAIREANFTPIVRLLTLIPDEELINIRYLNYVLDVTEVTHSGGSIPQLTVPNLKKVTIPVPPLEEQRRIAETLDKFDALVNDLSIGLPAELAARRQQYEYYRDKLLTFKELEAPE